MSTRNVHAMVSGQVQGVAYRAFALRAARAAEVTGWAKNLSDGRVEIMLHGTDAATKQVLDVLYLGPRFARVDHIEWKVLPAKPLTGFKIS